MREAVGETSLDDIPSGDHDDRQRARLSMHRQRIGNSGGDDGVEVCRDQLDGGGLALLQIPAGYSALDGQIMSLDPPEPRHRLVKMAARVCLVGDDETDARVLWRFLRTGPPGGHRNRRPIY